MAGTEEESFSKQLHKEATWLKPQVTALLSTQANQQCVRIINTFIRPKTETDRQGDRYIQIKT